jgi:hypothetical protein
MNASPWKGSVHAPVVRFAEGLVVELDKVRARVGSDLCCITCDVWSGQAVDEYGTCAYKLLAQTVRFATLGTHACDEPSELDRRARTRANRSERSRSAFVNPWLDKPRTVGSASAAPLEVG